VVLAVAWLGPRLTPSGSAVTAPLAGVRRLWPYFLVGYAAVLVLGLAYFVLMGVAREFLYQAFLLAEAAHPIARRFALWQDLPRVARSRPVAVPVAGAIALLAVAVWSRRGWLAWPALAVAAGLGLAAGLATWSQRPPGEPLQFLYRALLLLLAVNAAAAALSAAVHGPWATGRPWAARWRNLLPPPELPLFALVLQYLAQFTFSGMIYSYLGAFLTIPVAGLFLARVGAAAAADAGRWRLRPVLAVATLGAWLVTGSVALTSSTVYRDGARPQLTGLASAHKLAGVRTLPANAAEADHLMAAVARYSQPSEPVLILPDYPALYFLADRRPATRQTWYFEWMLTPGIVDEAVADLQQRPPGAVFVQSGVLSQAPAPSTLRVWPLYRYVTSTYRKVATVDGIDVYVPPDSACCLS
jgi:hypothetical protein